MAGQIHPRLAQMYGTVRDNVALPVIVRTKNPVDFATKAAARSVGSGAITYESTLSNSYGTTATLDVAKRLAELPNTVEVYPDEPTYVV